MIERGPALGPGFVDADVVVVGAGLVGMTVATTLATASINVVVVDAGHPMSLPPGDHLRNLLPARRDPRFFTALRDATLRPLTSREDRPPGAAGVWRRADIFGGMGTTWTGLAPRPSPFDDVVATWSPDRLDPFLDRAERLLRVSTPADPFDRPTGNPDVAPSPSRRQAVLRTALSARYHAGLRPLPTAAVVDADRRATWTGPAQVLDAAPWWAQDHVRLISDARAVQLTGAPGAVTVVCDADGHVLRVRGSQVVVAAGALDSAALLLGSALPNLRHLPVGAYLTDHPVSFARTVVPLTPAPTNGPIDTPVDGMIIDRSAERRFTGVVVFDAPGDPAVPVGVDTSSIASLYWYSPMAPQRENRLRLGGAQPSGGKCLTLDVELAEQDRRDQAAALADVTQAAELLGRIPGGSRPRALPLGSSHHTMGTTRMGSSDDGTCVCNPHGRVWGSDRLWVAGTGVIPGQTTANPTLLACALALATAGEILRD